MPKLNFNRGIPAVLCGLMLGTSVTGLLVWNGKIMVIAIILAIAFVLTAIVAEWPSKDEP